MLTADGTRASALASVLCEIAGDLADDVRPAQRFGRVLDGLQRVVPCDAAALLRLDGDTLIPVATRGLLPCALQRRFRAAEQPRLRALLLADGPLRFLDDDPQPDPFDDLIEVDGRSVAHAVGSCMGCPVRVEDQVVGVITVEAIARGRFDEVETAHVGAVAAMAAASVRTAALLDAARSREERQKAISRQLAAEALRNRGAGLLGESEAITGVRQQIRDVAPTDLPVLIVGETGVGKEIVARLVHAGSARAHEAIVNVNCAALPESIAESELFGHVQGAFTGAAHERAGRFEIADHGTVFLDEVGELSLALQAKLLRTIQFGEVQRLGAEAPFNVDVRVVAATNRDLEAEVRAGRFREDLYHRLCVFPIRVPPLRDRDQDVSLLVDYFLDHVRLKLGIARLRASDAARRRLARYAWPGNVRELEHVLLRAALEAAGRDRGREVVLEPEHLGVKLAPAAPPSADLAGRTLSEAVRDFERGLVVREVEAADGNWSEAARRLGMDRSNLHRLGRRLGIRRPR